jgi:hypothetical protein
MVVAHVHVVKAAYLIFTGIRHIDNNKLAGKEPIVLVIDMMFPMIFLQHRTN